MPQYTIPQLEYYLHDMRERQIHCIRSASGPGMTSQTIRAFNVCADRAAHNIAKFKKQLRIQLQQENDDGC